MGNFPGGDDRDKDDSDKMDDRDVMTGRPLGKVMIFVAWRQVAIPQTCATPETNQKTPASKSEQIDGRLVQRKLNPGQKDRSEGNRRPVDVPPNTGGAND